jgi:hypothetical protein
MSLTTADGIRKVANAYINGFRPELGVNNAIALESALESLSELADEMALLGVRRQLRHRIYDVQQGKRPALLLRKEK